MTYNKENPAPGIYAGLSNDDYHGGPGVSKSVLDLINRSPLHCRHALDNRDQREATAAQFIGTAAHALILEPDLFVANYCLELRRQDVPEAIDDRDQLVALINNLNADRLPKLATGGNKADQIARLVEATAGFDPENKLTADQLEPLKAADLRLLIDKLNDHRPGLLPVSGSRHEMAQILRDNGQPVVLWSDVLTEWQQNNPGRIVLTSDQWDQVHRMRDAVMDHPVAGKLLSYGSGVAELSAYWIDPDTGALCRCRPDFWRHDGILVDLKTTEDASPEEFARSIAKWRYHVQHPFYVDGCNHAIRQGKTDHKPIRAFVFVAVEKKPPYAVAVYALDPESVEIGRIEAARNLADFSRCQASGEWPGFSNKIESIGLPGWALRKSIDL